MATSKNAKTKSQWQIGFAQGDITPKPGRVMMTGYGHERHAVGTIAPLRAQALALKPAMGQTLLLITADVLGFDRTSVEAIRHSIAQAHGLPAAAIMLAASHTHWGPSTLYRMNLSVGGINTWYLGEFENAMIALAGKALESLSPGKVGYTHMKAQVGHNRRIVKDGKVAGWGPSPDNHYDHHTPIFVIERDVMPKRIVLVSHACHPTATGSVNKWSPDWPGAMRDWIEKKLGAGTAAMFAMGCGADAKTTYFDEQQKKFVFVADPKRSKKAGEKIGQEVVAHLRASTLEQLPGETGAGLGTGLITFGKGPDIKKVVEMANGPRNSCDTWWARQLLAYPDARKGIKYEAQAWRFGDKLTLVGLESEVCSPLGPLTRSLAQTEQAAVFGYVNTDECYIPSKKIVEEGGYEGNTSHRAYFLPAPFTTKAEAEFSAVVKKAIKTAGKK